MHNQDQQLGKVINWLGAGSINIFGRPFAGKDTQGHLLAASINAPVLGGGHILRNSVIPEHVKKIMHSGNLVPISDFIEIVLPYLSKEEFADKPLVLSSFGRFHGEEAGVLEATAASGHPLMAVIHLKISEEETWRRWKKENAKEDRGEREDDSYEALQVRLEEFRDKTIPVINFYRDQGMLLEFDSTMPKSDVTTQIVAKLAELAGHN